MARNAIDPPWRKSSRSAANGECVEAAAIVRRAHLRDSKDPGGPRLILTAQAWTDLLATIKERR